MNLAIDYFPPLFSAEFYGFKETLKSLECCISWHNHFRGEIRQNNNDWLSALYFVIVCSYYFLLINAKINYLLKGRSIKIILNNKVYLTTKVFLI